MDKITETQMNQMGIIIPCEPAKFGDFVTSILGKKQVIKRFFNGRFAIDLEQVKNFHYLLTQRVREQNKSNMITFETEIIFDDHSTITLAGIEELEKYNEIKPVASVAIVLTWNLLIQFENKKNPEHQKIEVTIRDGSLDSFYDPQDGFYRMHEDRYGQIELRIEHSSRTWGADIETLLTKHVDGFLRKPKKFLKFLDENEPLLGLGAGLLFMATMLTTSLKILNSSPLGVDPATLTAMTIAQKVDILVKAEQEMKLISSLRHFGLSFGVGIVGLIVFTAIIIRISNFKEPSFILLSRKSSENKTKWEGKATRSYFLILLSVLSSIALGKLADYICLKALGF